MTFSSMLARRAGIATATIGLALGVTAVPAQAMKPIKDRVVCIDYGAIPKAPKGAIPRDDHYVAEARSTEDRGRQVGQGRGPRRSRGGDPDRA